MVEVNDDEDEDCTDTCDSNTFTSTKIAAGNTTAPFASKEARLFSSLVSTITFRTSQGLTTAKIGVPGHVA